MALSQIGERRHGLSLRSGPLVPQIYAAPMSTNAVAIATEGLAAWRRGDFDAVEAILDPEVEWQAIEPGEWDCHGREDVMRTLRERYEQGFARGELHLSDAGTNTVIAHSHPSAIGGPEWPAETATVMRFEAGAVVSMQDYATKAEAFAAVEEQ
jgi:ketosteroid isomerase-like protein